MSCSSTVPLESSLSPDPPVGNQAEIPSNATTTSAEPTPVAEAPAASDAAQEPSAPVSSEGVHTLEADESHDEPPLDTEAAGQNEDSELSADHDDAVAETEAAPEVDTDAGPSRDARCEPAIPPPWAPPEFADTWKGTAIIVPKKLVDPWTGDAPVAPVALSHFEGAELVFHGACKVQRFDRDGTVRSDWIFVHPIQTVYSDGAGGIVYEQRDGVDGGSEVRWWPADADESTGFLRSSVGGGVLKDYLGVTVTEQSAVVLYTTVEWPEDDDECHSCQPAYREVLYRKSLDNGVAVSLDAIGGHEWGFEPTTITPDAVYGHNGTDGGQWNSAHALDPGTTADLPDLRGSDGVYSECFEGPGWWWCPTLIVPVEDDFVAGFHAFSDVQDLRLFVLAYIDHTSGEIVDLFPVVLANDGWNVLGVQVLGQRLILNTSNEYGHVGGRRVEHLRRPIIVDLASRSAEVYDRYGTFHLTPIWDHQP